MAVISFKRRGSRLRARGQKLPQPNLTLSGGTRRRFGRR